MNQFADLDSLRSMRSFFCVPRVAMLEGVSTMSFRKLMPLGFLLLLLVTRPAAATTIFADNFNANNPGNLGLNVTPLTWTIAGGTVDTLLNFPVSTGGACTT